MTRTPVQGPLTILVASPLEHEHVARIQASDPAVRVIHEPDLLGVPRYVADHNGHPRTLTAAQKEHWAGLLAQADILFDFDRANAADLPRLAPRLRWVQATSSGIGEFVRRTGLDRSSILFTTAAGVHARPLTEFVMLGLLHFFRGIPHLTAMKAKKHWERYTVEGLEGKRVLIVGLGQVGREAARQCAAFGMDVWGTRRSPGGEMPEGVTRWVAQSEIRAALPHVDALVLSCPLTEETKGLIGAADIAALKPGAVIVNIARGQVIDEPAMTAALASGHIRGAALDVFATEPLPKDNPLWDMPNVIVSPHSASTVDAENHRIVDLFLDNLQRFRDGRPMRNQFDAARGY
ncbi:D-2-hydroxyacid dehydrogenase [uncultured Alsobacter sp.]|uniref:D-2-hydroxyacid dehydrogenase n=1 Tax=uncultured Alsobacter sp. TaxID=1748258 RepID=UPI0025F506B4|nr:D-2-hydroxyacid dehydrogenase [uncultured Alsobacter sp.]